VLPRAAVTAGGVAQGASRSRKPSRALLLTYNQMVVDQRQDEQRTDLLFKALGDATRRDILGRVGEAELSVSALARLYPVSFAAIQKHVALLERAGLVSKERLGREQIVHAETDALRRAHQALDQLESLWRGRVERIDEILAQPTTKER
jgi:DNA-binding transcriptional ArsR family regulator